MQQKIKACVMDATKIRRVLQRMATEILERNRNLKNVVIIGIRTRGIYVGKRIAKLVKDMEKVDLPVGVIDIALYRDDVSQGETPPVAHKTDIPFSVSKKDVILVDDVLMTGRTIRAAMDGLFHLGRPQSIQLMVLIDRGHRELPLRADYIGKALPTSRRELVQVHLKETDGRDEVLIAEPVALPKGKK
jgi:pyrimidine operon attenuation protein / uracil phosphoribosyltransferase